MPLNLTKLSCTCLLTALLPAVVIAAPKLAEKSTIKPAEEIPVEAPGSDRIVMVLDGEPYTQTELAKFYQVRAGKPLHVAAMSRAELNDLLQQFSLQEMVKREASAAGFSTSDSDVEAYLEEIKKQNNMDEESLNEFLKQKGISRAAYVEQIKFEIVRNRLFSAKVRPKVALADEESNRLQKEQIKKDEEAAADGYVIEQLVYPGTTDKDEVDRAYIRAKAGEDLKAIGEKYFTDLGVVNPADLREELKELTEDMSVGDVSEPTKIDGNWIIQKRVKSVRSSTPTAKEDSAKAEEFERKFKAAAEKYLSEELPKKYNPEFKL